jgi:hypothetical protein
MANTRPEINTTNKSIVESRSEKKARLATILERGMVGDRLHVELPDDKYGEWVPNDKVEIYRMQSLGFEVDKEYAKRRALHNDGTDGISIVGDVIFMTCDRDTKDIMEEIKRENYDRVNSPKGAKEEKDFKANMMNSVTPPIDKSSTENVDQDAIKEALLQKS